jgi:hypothetical protein
MKASKLYCSEIDVDDIATSVKKDVFFHDLSEQLFISPNAEEDGKYNMVDQDTHLYIKLKNADDKDPLLAVSQYDNNTAKMFKDAYGMTVKEAITKAEYLEFGDAEETLIWCKNINEYAKHGWVPKVKDPDPIWPETVEEQPAEEPAE